MTRTIRSEGKPSRLEADFWSPVDRLLVDLCLFLLCWAGVAVFLGVIGIFEGWLVLLASIGVWLIWRRLLPRAKDRADTYWHLALALAIAVGVLNAAFPGEHLLTGRDSGTYLATAGWLAEDGSLIIDTGDTAFSAYDSLNATIPGFYDSDEGGVLQPQFMHSFPAMLATMIDIAGIGAALRLNAILGSILLLLVFALGRRFLRSGSSLLASAVIASGLVFTYYSRAPFTEVLMAVFVVAGVWVYAIGEDHADKRLALIGGLFLGGAALVRLDGIVVLVPSVAYFTLKTHFDASRKAVARDARIAMLAVAAFGLAESLIVSPYVLERSNRVVPVLFAVIVVMLLIDLFGDRMVALARSWNERRHLFVNVVVAVGLIALLYAAIVRPAVVDVAGNAYGLESIEDVPSDEVLEGRNFAEYSVHRLAWYHGWPFIVMAFAGASIAFRQLLLGQTKRVPWLLLALFVCFSVLYLWQPSINPDQIWSMRRYVPVVIPFGAMMAALAVESLAAEIRFRFDHRSLVSTPLCGALWIGLLLPPLVVLVPLWNVGEFNGLTADFGDACDLLGADANVLILDDSIGAFLTQGFRSYCGVPAASNGDQLSVEELRRLETEIEDSGGNLVLLEPGRSADGGQRLLDGPYERFEITLFRPPSRTVLTDPVLSISAGRSDRE